MVAMGKVTDKRSRHRRNGGRRRVESRFRVLRGLARILDAYDALISFVALVGSPESQTVLPLDFQSSSSSRASRLSVPWRKAKSLAKLDALPDEPWVEHRVGVIVQGPEIGRYIAARPSTAGIYDVLVSRKRSRKGLCVLYREVPRLTLEEATNRGNVRWLPVGIHADSITSAQFRRAHASPAPLTTLTQH